AGIAAQRERVAALKAKIANDASFEAKALLPLADDLVEKAVWIIGGDGWSYDIGYGGLDHVLASGRNINVLILDTEVYSNTGGQMSKSTPIGAVAKFATKGKSTPKKDIGMLAVGYGNIYVAQVSMGAKDTQVVQAMREAESYKGASLVIAYSHCISHGFNLASGAEHQKVAVDSGYWPLYRYDPRKIAKGENPFKLDSADPKLPVMEHMKNENRFKQLMASNPARAEELAKEAQAFVDARWAKYKYLANK
ncbi:MAG: pyruvate:ferredoxin (flavodoxin) oxidoreductase, partial [Opitutales bacterium]|nr:pyruvate:ferredoxin (flavodoxin) oxidoreductase [Opitutales bacterium]